MPLATLLTFPYLQDEWLQWVMEHNQDHIEIRQAIQKQHGVNLSQYVLDPIDIRDPLKWLTDHQQTHNDMDGVLGLQSNDLTTVNFKDEIQRQAWATYNYLEHYAARAALGI